MRKNKLLIFILYLFILGCFLVACKPSYKYNTEQSLYVVDSIGGNSDIYETGGFSYVSDNAKYFFSNQITIKKRDQFINAQEMIFEYLMQSNYIDGSVVLTIYVFSNQNGFTRSNNLMFVANIADVKTHKQILLTLQAIYGDFTNYGLLFGFGNIIAKKINFSSEIPNISNNDLKTFWATPEKQVFFDLTYTCFTATYTTDNERDRIKKTSYLLTDFIYKKDGGILLSELLTEDYIEFEYTFVMCKNEWLNSIGSSTVLAEKEFPIFFTCGGVNYPLVIKTESVIYYLKNTFREWHFDIYGKDFFKSDYTTLVNTLEILEYEMKKLDGKLRDVNYNYGDYKVILQSVDEVSGGSYYGNSRTYASTVSVLIHEYVHHLTKMISYNDWRGETMSTYYGYNSFFMKSYFINLLENSSIDFSVYETYLGREITLNDIFIFESITAFLYEAYDVYTLYSTASKSFSYYLVNEYGEENYILLFTTNRNNPQMVTGKSFTQMRLDWIEWLESEFGCLKDLV